MDMRVVEKLLGTRVWRLNQGRAAVQMWQESEMSGRRFSAATGISIARLNYWRARCEEAVEHGGIDEVDAEMDETSVPRFVELAVAPEPVHEEIRCFAELAGPGPWRIRLAADFDEDAVHRLLSLLEARC